MRTDLQDLRECGREGQVEETHREQCGPSTPMVYKRTRKRRVLKEELELLASMDVNLLARYVEWEKADEEDQRKQMMEDQAVSGVQAAMVELPALPGVLISAKREHRGAEGA
ncbi:hypothetical protein MAPG_10950 [Magnaporthiopsis poae ATCC 64411]|uniref:Uncharacterized protein n=1 Tax=Magnaporthiopsis poae (strain ATCC 64411 / 73-15) TaxID=644358 RepID=A0A0C4EDZ0_MAGP6|nr:hypothetical protein MAPG_10950 [Magnaporthiopsis poae ATCC 64411]